MNVSKVFLFILLSFLGGIFIGSFFKAPSLIFYELIVLGIFYGAVFFKYRAILCFAICLLVLALGMWRGSQAIEPTSYSTNQGYFPFLKDKLQAVISQNFSPPQDGLLSAILLGNKQVMSKSFKEKLNIAGIRHITAISGMHIVIISRLLFVLALALGLWRGQAFYFAVVFLWLFIFLIGLAPSAVRAGIMASMFLLAEKLGRQKTADRALLLTAGVMLAINPSLLRYSIGFQLSFLACLGIIYLMEGAKLLPKGKELSSFHSLIAMSFAAQIFVLPLLLYHFGQVSIVSPLTNLLVVPFLPFLMSVGFMFVVLGVIWQPLSFIMLFPVWLMLTYITKITELFAGLSFSTIDLQIHWLCLPIIYGFLAIIIWRIKKRQKAAQFLV